MSYLGSWEKDMESVARTAREVLAHPGTVILDTETTGLGSGDRIVQIAVVDIQGNTLFNRNVNPQVPIGERAQEIHGITPEMVADEPAWNKVFPELCDTLRSHGADQIMIYNADFDRRMIAQSSNAYPECAEPFARFDSEHRFRCAMRAYAVRVGDWWGWKQEYRWPRLPGGDHSALGDCLATLRVMREITQWQGEDI